jgi:uncharacterized protein
MKQESIQQKFIAALDALVENIKDDRAILAAILCGSLSHDTVWKKSDIDLVLVTVDDKKVAATGLALNADGINVHAILMPRAEFRRVVEGSVHQSFGHSFLAKGRLLYTHDPTIADLCDRLHTIGNRDAAVQLLRAAMHALPEIDKAHKWFVTRRDLNYTTLWILFAATSLAQMEVIGAGQLVDREALPQAMILNPEFFTTIYTDLLNERKTPSRVQAALTAVDQYIADRAPQLFAVVIDYLHEAGEARSCTEIEDYFKKHFDLGGVTIACEYLADHGLIGKAATAVRLTKRSNVEVQELAFYYMAEGPNAV